MLFLSATQEQQKALTMFNSLLSQSNVNAVADQIDFGQAMLATKDPIMQARAVATYRRLVERAQSVTSRLNESDKKALIGAACIEVENRRYRQFEDVRAKRARIAELQALREELTFTV